jgi:hypothetical protein
LKSGVWPVSLTIWRHGKAQSVHTLAGVYSVFNGLAMQAESESRNSGSHGGLKPIAERTKRRQTDIAADSFVRFARKALLLKRGCAIFMCCVRNGDGERIHKG